MIPMQPDFMEQPFANQGARNTIPNVATDEIGRASLKEGFPIQTEMTLEEGGLPPQRKDFNAILNWLSTFAFYQQSGGIFRYSASNSYTPPAMVWLDDMLWFCVKENGASSKNGVKNPKSEKDYWKSLPEYLNIYQKSTLDDLIKQMQEKVNAAIASLSSASSFSVNLSAGGSASFVAPLNVKKISCIANTNFVKSPDGGYAGTNVVQIQNVGNITMSASVTKSGSKGHYWGYEPTKSAASDFNVNIAKGATITISTQSSGNLGVASTSVLLVLS